MVDDESTVVRGVVEAVVSGAVGSGRGTVVAATAPDRSPVDSACGRRTISPPTANTPMATRPAIPTTSRRDDGAATRGTGTSGSSGIGSGTSRGSETASGTDPAPGNAQGRSDGSLNPPGRSRRMPSRPARVMTVLAR